MTARVIRKLRRLREHYREGGLRHTLEVASGHRYIPSAIYYYHRTQILQLASREKLFSIRARPGYQHGTATPDDLDELASLDKRADPRWARALFARFLSGGAACYVIRKDERIIAYNWLFGSEYVVTADNYQARQIAIALRDNQVVFGNGYIAAEYRMKGLFPMLIQQVVQDRPEETHFFSTIEQLNANSMKSHRRLGFVPVGTFTCRRLLGSPYFWSWDTAASTSFLGFHQPRVALHPLLAGT